MIICDVCETLIISTAIPDDLIICPNCGFDNSYQIEEEGLVETVILTLDEYDALDDDTLIQLAFERFGLPEDKLIEIIHDQEMVGRNLKIKGRK